MEPKKRLEMLLDAYFIQREEQQAKLRDIQLNMAGYTPEEQARLRREQEAVLSASTAQLALRLEEVLKGVIAKQANAKAQAVKRQTTTSYLLARSGALELLRLGASGLTSAQVQEAVLPFRDDPVAMAAFHGALAACGWDNRKVKAVLGDVRSSDETIALLEKLLRDLNAAIVPNPVYGMTMERPTVMMLLEPWSDDLNRRR